MTSESAISSSDEEEAKVSNQHATPPVFSQITKSLEANERAIDNNNLAVVELANALTGLKDQQNFLRKTNKELRQLQMQLNESGPELLQQTRT